MTEEHRLQNEIRAVLSENCIIFRMNVGTARTEDGRYLSTGVPAGFSDLFGVRLSDGKAVFIEVKTKSGRVSEKQKHFIEVMKNAGAVAGVCRSVQEAVRLIETEDEE